MSIYTDKYAFIVDIEKYIIRCVEKNDFISYQVVEGSRYESWIYVIGKKNKAENYQKMIQIIYELKLDNYFDVFYGEGYFLSLDSSEPTFKVGIRLKYKALKFNRITHKLDNTYTLLKLRGLIV